ncbi:MAG: exodeoxyribonuclease III [bacterium]|nr:exodeoxyribonuclease III [bacterium]
MKQKLLSWNVNGLRAVHRKGIVSWIQSEDPDILCLQETKARKEQLPEDLQELSGYHSFFSFGERAGYSGVATYTKEKPLETLYGFGRGKVESEGRVLVHVFKNYTLFNIYFPNGKRSPDRLAYKMDFYMRFLKYAQARRKKGEHIIFCGDINTAHKEIDLARPRANEKISGFLPKERAWIDEVVKQGYHDTLRMYHAGPELYSWWDMQSRARDRNVGWRIDYFFVSDGIQGKIKDAFILSDVMGSDHAPVGISIDI